MQGWHWQSWPARGVQGGVTGQCAVCSVQCLVCSVCTLSSSQNVDWSDFPYPVFRVQCTLSVKPGGLWSSRNSLELYAKVFSNDKCLIKWESRVLAPVFPAGVQCWLVMRDHRHSTLYGNTKLQKLNTSGVWQHCSLQTLNTLVLYGKTTSSVQTGPVVHNTRAQCDTSLLQCCAPHCVALPGPAPSCTKLELTPN